MSLRRYVPSGRGGSFAIVAVLGAAVVAGVVTGVIEGVVNRWLSLFFVFPLLIGVAAGGVAAVVVGKLKLRAPAIALICGFVGGAAGYAAEHVTGYVQFRIELAGTIAQQHPGTSEAEVSTMIDDLLRREAGAPGIVGYLELAARTGVKIKRAASYDKDGLTFAGTAAWLLWAAELLTAAVTAGAIAFARAREPFCEACDTWFGPAATFVAGGADSRETITQLTSALGAGDPAGAARAFYTRGKMRRSLQLTARNCPGCGTDTYVRLVRVTGKKPRQLEGWLMPASELARLKDALGHAAAS